MSSRKQKPANKKGQAVSKPATRPNLPGTAPNFAIGAVVDAIDEAGWTRVKVVAELLEDAHPGSGSGGGGIDALVSRDRRGQPVIWASHLEGPTSLAEAADSSSEPYSHRFIFRARIPFQRGGSGGPALVSRSTIVHHGTTHSVSWSMLPRALALRVKSNCPPETSVCCVVSFKK